MTSTDLMRGHRAVMTGVLGAVALLAVGVWGVVNLLDGDWFIGGLFVACALVGVPSMLTTVRRLRREERRASSVAGRRHAPEP